MVSREIFLTALLSVLLVGCVTLQTPEPGSQLYEQSVREKQDQLLKNIENQSRLRGIVYPILKANTDLCRSRSTTRRLEFEWLTLNDLRLIGMVQRDAGAAMGISTFPYVTVLTPGSPAYQAGLRTGDTLTSINNEPLEEDKERKYLRIAGEVVGGYRHYREDLDEILRRATWDDVVTLQYKRGDETHRIEVQPERRCNFNIAMVAHDDLSSKAAEDILVVSSALLDFAESDAEVQFIVAHELAHYIYKHRPGRLTPLRALALGADAAINSYLLLLQVAAGGVAAAATGDSDPIDGGFFMPGALFSRQNNPPYRHVLELEADYLAMYLLARSGIDASGYPDFWKRIPPESQLAKVHVMEEGRIENMKAVLEEIEQKMKSNLPLEPSRSKKVED